MKEDKPKKVKQERTMRKEDALPWFTRLPEAEAQAQDNQAADEERRKRLEDLEVQISQVRPSPFVPQGLSSIGTTYHKTRRMYQVSRKFGRTMFYGKPKVQSPDEISAAVMHDLWLLRGGPLVPPLTPQDARNLGLNYDLGVHKDADVIRLLAGTTGATAFSTFSTDVSRLKRIRKDLAEGKAVFVPVPESYQEGSRLLRESRGEGFREGSKAMPEWRRLPGMATVNVRRVHRGNLFGAYIPSIGLRIRSDCKTREEAAIAADLYLLNGGRRNPPLTRQDARDHGLNYDLGVHDDEEVARLLEGTDPTTAFTKYHTRLIEPASSPSDPTQTPAKRKRAAGEVPTADEKEARKTKRRQRRMEFQHVIATCPPMPADESAFEDPEGCHQQQAGFLREVVTWLAALGGGDGAAVGGSGGGGEGAEGPGKRYEVDMEGVLGLSRKRRAKLCRKVNLYLQLFYGDGLTTPQPLTDGEECAGYCWGEIRKALKRARRKLKAEHE